MRRALGKFAGLGKRSAALTQPLLQSSETETTGFCSKLEESPNESGYGNLRSNLPQPTTTEEILTWPADMESIT